jgi:aryl-alcohol dehydrogenase-like predicted oxidoreductase
MTGAGRAPGLSAALSRVVMGTVHPAPEVWELYVARGGACFDTARHYGDASEGELGRFLDRHCLRERVVIVGKGAHPPTCAPEHVNSQLERSLELLRTDHLDVYLLHRDDPRVPVGEWADALAPHLDAGRVRAIGASNWTPARYERFNEEAARRRLTPFSLVSNQLSLAEMLEPVWDTCLRADEQWHERTQTPLLAWSALARGFFAGRRDSDAEVRRSWLSEENAECRRRAEAIAADRGLAPAVVALAWLLARPFPTFAVVGPRSQAELDGCLAATELELRPDELSRLGVAKLAR